MEKNEQRKDQTWLEFFAHGNFMPVCAEWSEIIDALLSHFPGQQKATEKRGVAFGYRGIQILVMGCGDSKISQWLHDVGFRNIRNFPLSKDVIKEMRLFQNFRDYPLPTDVIKQMREQFVSSRPVTDMFAQLDKESFDVVLDKGGLHALVDPELGPELGNQYLSEVKRVLKHNGRFICLTLAEPCVSGLLFRTFRCGWEMSLQDIPLKSSEWSGLLPFVVTAKKNSSCLFSCISSSINQDIPVAKAPYYVRCTQEYAQEALKIENQIRLQNTHGLECIKIVHQDTSPFMCSLVVVDVKYENNEGIHCPFQSTDLTFRRLITQRSEGLYQSKALLRRSELDGTPTVDHNFLANSYNIGIISGFSLISSYLENVATQKGKVRGLVIGLQAGLLPMFLNKRLSFLDIDVVEPDGTAVKVAKKYFGFCTGENLKVHAADGIEYVKGVAYNYVDDVLLANFGNKDAPHRLKPGVASVSTCAVGRPSKLGILIIDMDSTDSSFGLACPSAVLIEESFLKCAKKSLTKQGLFVINLVSRSRSTRDMVFSRLKMVFVSVFFLDLKDGTVFFALNEFVEVKGACGKLSRLLNPEQSNVAQSIQDTDRQIISSVAKLIQDTAEKIECFK